jgi:L-ascorbate metabolism protein UlaG (beta-lactamase superfamily)
MRVTYYGHSCFLVEVKGKKILFDPFISGNPLAANIRLDSIAADYILLSHAHSDHTADALVLAQMTGATIVGVWEIHAWAQRNGIQKTHPMNIGGIWEFDFGTVKMVQAVHSSSFEDGSYGGQAAGFYIETEEGNFYYAGDTALHNDMKLLGKHFDIDFAFLPIGSNFTMGIDDAMIACKYIKCDTAIGMHYDTFGYIKIDHEAAKKKFVNQDKTLILMEIGVTKEFKF